MPSFFPLHERSTVRYFDIPRTRIYYFFVDEALGYNCLQLFVFKRKLLIFN